MTPRSNRRAAYIRRCSIALKSRRGRTRLLRVLLELCFCFTGTSGVMPQCRTNTPIAGSPPEHTISRSSLGVRVIQTDPNTHRGDGPQADNRWPERRLPLADNTFDVVLASRSAFSPVEVARVLRPGGRLVTIQNGVEWRGETLADALGGARPEWTIPGHGWNVGETLRESGLRVLSWHEQATSTTYHDIGAVVYTLLHVPWLIADFDVSRFRDRIYRLHQPIQREGAFTSYGYVYLIEAAKA